MKLETMVLGPLETNCYLLWDEQTMEAAVIDPGASGQKIADRLAQNGLMLRMILLTHAHFDHIGGLQQLHELTGAPVWVSKIDSTDPAEMTHGRLIFTNTYEDGDELTLGHIKIHVIARRAIRRGASACSRATGCSPAIRCSPVPAAGRISRAATSRP